MKYFAIIALACLALCTVAGRACAAVEHGVLQKGGVYYLQSNPTVSTAALEVWFRVPSAGYDSATPGIAQLAAASCAAAKLEGGRSLAEFVHSVGGRLTVEVHPDMLAVAVVVPAAQARRAIATLTSAYFAPRITADALKIAQADADVLVVERKYDPDHLLQDALFAELFASGPNHMQPLPATTAELLAPKLDAVQVFAKRAFRSGNAVVALAGNIDASALDAVTDGGDSTPADLPYDSHVGAGSQDKAISGPADGIGLAWAGPPITDERAATAMDFINDYLFRENTGAAQLQVDKSNALAAAVPRPAHTPEPMNVNVTPPSPPASPAPGASPGPRRITLQLVLHPVVPTPAPPTDVQGQFITLHDPGVMVVTISGGAAGAAAASDAILQDISALEHPLDAAVFARALAAFQYHILSDTQTPITQADNLGWYAIQGNADYAPGSSSSTYMRNAASLDPSYVAQVARLYLHAPVIVHMNAVPETSK